MLFAVLGQASASEDRKIWLVVLGLLAVALALTALTVRYWRITKPVANGEATPSERSRTSERRSRSKRSEHSERRGSARQAGEGPAVAALLDQFDEDDIFVTTASTPATVMADPAGEVATVPEDHAEAGDEWRSRATGEHPIVQTPPDRPVARPSRAQRSRVLGDDTP